MVPPPLAVTDVRHVGDPIALVVATDRYMAEDACDLIEVDFEAEQAAPDYRQAAGDGDHVVHAGWGLESNVMMAVPFQELSPQLDETFAAAEHVVEVTIEQNRYLCVPMETRGIVASWDMGREELSVVCSTQSVHETRNFFSRYLGMPGSQHQGHRQRRGRWVRPEDVRVSRGVRHRPRFPAAGPAGQMDRGPPRESGGRSSFAQ